MAEKGNNWLAFLALYEAFKIAFVIFREYRGMARRKIHVSKAPRSRAGGNKFTRELFDDYISI